MGGQNLEEFSDLHGAYYCPAFGRLMAAMMAGHGLSVAAPSSCQLQLATTAAPVLTIGVLKPRLVQVAQLIADGKERPALVYWLDQAGGWYPIECRIADSGQWRYGRVKRDQATGLESLISVKLEQQKEAAHFTEQFWLAELASYLAARPAA